jgi:adenine-specific DNA-methyltransferase
MAHDDKPIGHHIHDETRANIPSAELEPVMEPSDREAIKVAYERRNRDLDPQLIWRGKDMDQAELTVDAPPIYLQEQVHPKALIDDLRAGREKAEDLFGHFGLTEEDREAEVEFYRHSRKWSNRMILGDGLQVMASLSEREGLKGQVQTIYIDPPYGINFGSNFQWSTTSKTVTDGKLEHLTQEPEQVKAFRDTWRDGIHSYLSYLRDRLTVARELLHESGSCFVQISDENVHRVRSLLDEVFGDGNFIAIIPFRKKTMPFGAKFLEQMDDFILWYGKDKAHTKYRQLFIQKDVRGDQDWKWFIDEDGYGVQMDSAQHHTHFGLPADAKIFRMKSLEPSGNMESGKFAYDFQGIRYGYPKNGYGTKPGGMKVLDALNRLQPKGNFLNYRLLLDDYPISTLTIPWQDTVGADNKTYVVQTNSHVVKRCLLMTTDPGDLVLDPTCGSGTTAFVAENWGRRWITIDTSRVALALARSRVMGAKFPWYLLSDSTEGQKKSAEISGGAPSTHTTHNDIRHGFVYERVPHITLRSIANNNGVEVIWQKMQPAVDKALSLLNDTLVGQKTPFFVKIGGRKGEEIDFTSKGEVTLLSGEKAPSNGFMEWEVPRQAPKEWSAESQEALAALWKARIARQKKIDDYIAAEADNEHLYDKPYEDKKRVRVAGPFTVESLSPHRTQAVDEHGELIEEADAAAGKRSPGEQEAENYRKAIIENLAKAGVHQQDKSDAIRFDSLAPWPGDWIAAEGQYVEGTGDDAVTRRAAIFIGPEYGTVGRADLVACAREAAEADFDIVIACAFNFEAHAQELHKLGRIPVLHARMNADLHMAGDLKAGGGNLFVVFGEPDIEVTQDGEKFRVELKGVDIFRPGKGEVESSEPDDIACWFIDTDYSGESFFVRQAYFPGADVPYKQLRSTLKGEIDEEAWESLKRTVSRPFARPKSGRIAVKVINHLGDEVMKVMGV